MHSATEQTLQEKWKCTSFDLTWFTHVILNLLIPNTYTKLVPRKNPNFGANDKTVKCWEFPTSNWHFPSEKEATCADGLRCEWVLSLGQPSANQSKRVRPCVPFVITAYKPIKLYPPKVTSSSSSSLRPNNARPAPCGWKWWLVDLVAGNGGAQSHFQPGHQRLARQLRAGASS